MDALEQSNELAATEENPEAENSEGSTTAVETGDDTAVESEAPDSDEEQESTESEEEKPKKPGKSGFQKRIDELTRKVHERDRFITEMQERVLAEQQELSQQPQNEAETLAPEDFDDYESYIKAVAVQEVEQRMRAERQQGVAKQTERLQQQAAQHTESIRQSALDAGKEIYSDFVEVTTSQDLPITPAMGEAVLNAKNAPQVWYHLGKNPDIAAGIAQMPPTQQVMAVAQLSMQVGNGEPVQKPSNAPTPSKAIKSRAPASKKAGDKDDIKSWMTKRNKEIYG